MLIQKLNLKVKKWNVIAQHLKLALPTWYNDLLGFLLGHVDCSIESNTIVHALILDLNAVDVVHIRWFIHQVDSLFTKLNVVGGSWIAVTLALDSCFLSQLDVQHCVVASIYCQVGSSWCNWDVKIYQYLRIMILNLKHFKQSYING